VECLGCRIANQDEPVQYVYENEYVCCVLDIAPFNEGHTLILPKKHVEELDELDLETSLAVLNATKKISILLKTLYNADGVSICQNGGVFNDLDHFHIHVIPRFKGDGFSWSEPLNPSDAENHLLETKKKMIDQLNLLSSNRKENEK
jgi:histidine triad (HIT) family protein